MYKCGGFNLLELIVAMALGSLLVLTLISIYAAIKRTAQLHEDWLQLIDNGRYAVFVLRRDFAEPHYEFFVAPTPYQNAQATVIKGLYERDGKGNRELIALNINRIVTNKNQISLDLASEDQKIKREWIFNA